MVLLAKHCCFKKWIFDFGYTISYWKTSNNAEVDFVLYGKKGIKAFEIKRTRRISVSMLRGLKAFLKDYPMAKAYFIYGGKRYMREGKIEILPMESAFRELHKILER
jgi:predicted AAA+ superfamily ATPase